MNSVSTLETRIFQLLLVILAIICFVPGGVSAFGGMNASSALGGGAPLFDSNSLLRGFADNQYRFGFGVFFTQGLVLLFSLRNLNKYGTLIRFSLLALAIGGVARLTNILEFGIVDPQVVGPTVIELVIVPLLALWHGRVSKRMTA